MGTIGKVLFGLAICGAVYAWIQSHQVPDGFMEPGKLKLFFAMMSVFKKVNTVVSLFTDSNPLVAAFNSMQPDLPTSVTKEEKYIEGRRTVIYRPVGESKMRPAIIYYHGGAFILGSPEGEQTLLSDYVNDLGVTVIATSYRLAPDHPFPAGFDDCYKVTKYILANAKEFNIDPKRILIAGASAGGDLAAAVGTKLRDEGLAKKIRGQLLLIPVMQAHDFATKSYRENKYDSILTQEFMIEGWAKYALGHKYKDAMQSMIDNTHVPKEKRDEFVKLCGNSPLLDKTVNKPTNLDIWKRLQPYLENPYFAPLVAKDLTGMAPTILLTTGQDVLRDEGLIYGERLRKSGVEVFSYHSASSFHGTLGLKSICPLDYDREYQAILPYLKKLLL